MLRMKLQEVFRRLGLDLFQEALHPLPHGLDSVFHHRFLLRLEQNLPLYHPPINFE